jgi:hypothetical protein
MPEGVYTVQVVAGGGFTFALTDTGAVYGWGLFKDEVLDQDAKQFCGGSKLQRLPKLIYQPEDVRDRIIKLAAGEQGPAPAQPAGQGEAPVGEGWGAGVTPRNCMQLHICSCLLAADGPTGS